MISRVSKYDVLYYEIRSLSKDMSSFTCLLENGSE